MIPPATQWGGPEGAYPFVAAIGAFGIAPPNQTPRDRRHYRNFLQAIAEENVLGGRSLEAVVAESKILSEASRDGVGIPRPAVEKARNTSVLLVIDSRALRPDDRESVAQRLSALPAGGAVLFYSDASDPRASRLLMVKEFPRLRFVRRSYRQKISLTELETEVRSRGREYGIPAGHAGFLFSDVQVLESEGKIDVGSRIQALGFAVQFDPARLDKKYPSSRGMSGAVLGELTKLAQLPKDQRALALSEARFFELRNGVYSLLNEWFEARTSEAPLATAA